MRAPAPALSLIAALLAAAPAPADDGFVVLDGHGGPVMGLAASPDGARALSASFDYSVGYWDLATGKLIRWLEGHDAAVNAVAFSPDGRLGLSAGDDFDAVIWDLATGAPTHRLHGHRGKIRAAVFSPDGRMAATAGWDGRAGLWDVRTGALLRWLEGHGGAVNDVAFGAGGAKIWTASQDGTVRRWDVDTGAFERIEVKHGFGVNQVVISDDGGWLAYGAVDGGTRVLSLATGEELADVTLDRRPILALALRADGRELAVGDGDGFIMILSTADWTVTRDFRAFREGPVWALAWAGARLISGGLEPRAPVWPVGAAAAAAPFGAAEQPFHRRPEEMDNGERQFVRKCSICHTLAPGPSRKAGPSLHGVFGRRAGALAGYAYSPALRRAGIVWSDDTIDLLFRDGPERVTPGSKMPMQRIAGANDRADLIAFLRRSAGEE